VLRCGMAAPGQGAKARLQTGGLVHQFDTVILLPSIVGVPRLRRSCPRSPRCTRRAAARSRGGWRRLPQ
jgi:hypothetical protein